jgi:hypothetical protein
VECEIRSKRAGKIRVGTGSAKVFEAGVTKMNGQL